ncbi:hypothetical protein CDV55_105875 [Aspergillus turcosus]|uniref:Uncharacterized protein n=1 Tax=Aspergillus turcosus TaxID=1245748 RepID=A0A229XIH5_9EURO|nr:hypothetical protein CDV55_105875 [Aspergillus turcosus]RLL98870.1 hypothetical protein CFD26_106146 [Aspergillus turcosus]
MDMTRIPSNANTRGLFLKGHRRRVLRDNIMGITKPAIRHPNHSRLARRGGVVRMRTDIYPEIRSVIKVRLRDVRILPLEAPVGSTTSAFSGEQAMIWAKEVY